MGKAICVRNFRDSRKKYVAGEEYKDGNLESLVKIGVVKDESQLSDNDKKHIAFVQDSIQAAKSVEDLAKQRKEAAEKRRLDEFKQAQEKKAGEKAEKKVSAKKPKPEK